MIHPRPLVPARDTCSRATPSPIVHRVAGMAFNFSTTQLPGITSTEIPSGRDASRPPAHARRAARDLYSQYQVLMI